MGTPWRIAARSWSTPPAVSRAAPSLVGTRRGLLASWTRNAQPIRSTWSIRSASQTLRSSMGRPETSSPARQGDTVLSVIKAVGAVSLHSTGRGAPRRSRHTATPAEREGSFITFHHVHAESITIGFDRNIFVLAGPFVREVTVLIVLRVLMQRPDEFSVPTF